MQDKQGQAAERHDALRARAEQQLAEHPTAVCDHHDHVAAALARRFGDFFVDLARQLDASITAFIAEPPPPPPPGVHGSLRYVREMELHEQATAQHAQGVLADFGRDCRPLCAALAERGVLVRDMTGFGMEPRFARIGVGTESEHARLVEALTATLRGAAGAA